MSMTEESMEELITGPYDYRPPQRGDVREGVIVSMEDHQAIVDIGGKREGVVPKRDLELLGEEAVAQLAVGDEVAVYVMRPEDRDGNLRVSINRAQQEADWERARELLESEKVWEEEVVGHNRGGLLISFGRIQGFIPQSHVAELPRGLSREQRLERLPEFVGQKMPVKVVEVDRRRRRLVLSNRAAIRAWRREQRERLLGELTEGEVVHGTVSSLCDFGVFVDLGGADGLVHVSELAWHRVRHPSEVLEEGQEVDVYVLRLDYDRQRIGLSLKRLQPDPWSLVASKYVPGDLVEGVVTNVVDFGAFVRVEEGVEGLVHVSEMPDGLSPEEAVQPGERVLVRVLHVQPDRRRMGLSLREVTPEERAEWLAQQEAEAPSREHTGFDEAEQADHGVDQPVAEDQAQDGVGEPEDAEEGFLLSQIISA
jgi:small subunit ribosomal protein S1